MSLTTNKKFNGVYENIRNDKVTKEALILGSDKKFKSVKKDFPDILPPKGVAIYTSIE